MYNERRIKNSERLQLILLDNLYAQSGSEQVIFQGGTAIRWVYGGLRFSEDLDFVTGMSREKLERLMEKTFPQTHRACIAQFGIGEQEIKVKVRRKEAKSFLYIYRPQMRRQRIAVKLEFEFLRSGQQPESERFILRELPLVRSLIAAGELMMPYSSSIILAETAEEIFSDKIRAIYERRYLKGRDLYDIWWLKNHLKITPSWDKVEQKLNMYEIPFVPFREAGYFQKESSMGAIIQSLETDLPRFVPENILSMYQGNHFSDFVATLKDVTSFLMEQGMNDFFSGYERGKSHH
ncbi:MAG: nucleotidyl transferase AbiEii/AbiGii toxin family protein [Deltaproteobacteria bacterium]|nr:nucleotidyl transferase AbiEii/AbiGii toxin family protein [Deltaproteobacteria bacterium]